MEFSTHVRSDEVEIERRIREFLLGSDPIVIRYMESIAVKQGKRLRPKLVMIFARLFGDYDYDKCITSASATELLHTATLIHDDVIDTADLRRGTKTVSSEFGNEIAVIVGDYLLAILLGRLAKLRDFTVLEMFVETSKMLGVGVIEEVNNRNNFELTVERYFNVIELKTAVLFGLCSRLGAYLGGASEEDQDAAGRYGKEFGMAFQIVDDLLDIAVDPDVTGKPAMSDLKEGRITLPFIYAMSEDEATEGMMAEWQGDPSGDATVALITHIERLGAIDFCVERAEEHLAKALKSIEAVRTRIREQPSLGDLEVIHSGLFSLLPSGPQGAPPTG